MNANVRYVLGSMTGTSCDGLDWACCEVRGHGLDMKVRLIEGCSFEWGGLGDRLRAFAEGQALSAAELCRLNRDFSDVHVKSCQEMLADTSSSCYGLPIDVVGIHGQTVFHAAPLSWQMVDLSYIAARLNLPVMGDFRGADLALGGQGAPISPLGDLIAYGSSEESRCLVNLGGFCNLTFLPKGRSIHEVQGRDVCAVNQALNALSRRFLGLDVDLDGAQAAQGEIDEHWFEGFYQIFSAQSKSGRSLGQADLFSEAWLSFGDEQSMKRRVNDLLRSAVEAMAQVMAEAIHQQAVDRVLFAGGGWKHLCLQDALKRRLNFPVGECVDVGPCGEYREAVIIAVLTCLSRDRVPITLPQVTGGPEAVVSGLYADPTLV